MPPANLVNLVEHHQHRLFRRADFHQHRVHRVNLLLRLRMADVHDVHQQIRLHHFFQRGLERLDQTVRQFFDEAHGVGEQNILLGRQLQPPRRRVERGE
jgi:hypothetical protein